MVWKIKSLPRKKSGDFDDQNYPSIIKRLLRLRGLEEGAEIEEFLDPDYDRGLHDPYLFIDMKKAVDRIYRAVKNNESVLIFGDYDVDGVSASVILANVFDWLGFDNYQVYIPDRYTEQYGLSLSNVEQFLANNIDLMITVDCGITGKEEVERAISGGLDVIVTDHHQAPEQLPEATAVIDPKCPGEKYPYDGLSGAGVAFKLAQALVLSGYWPQELPAGREKWLLDLVALATISDMMPVDRENRVLVRYGLVVLRQARRPGLAALLKKVNIKPENVNENDIGFMLGPRLNAASRLAHASEAYDLLTARRKTEAEKLAKHLDGHNRGRKSLVDKILDWATEALGDPEEKVLVLGREDFSVGVLGLAASRLVEKYGRPVFVWTVSDNGEIKGSCRSDGSVNVVNLMTAAGGRGFFSDFGGHAQAGGFSLPSGHEGELAVKLNQAHSQVEHQAVEETVCYEAKLVLADINEELWGWLVKLSPFGPENPQPIFLIKELTVKAIRVFGANDQHLELKVGDRTGRQFVAIDFFRHRPDWLEVGSTIDVLVKIERSYWGRPSLRLHLAGIRPSTGS